MADIRPEEVSAILREQLAQARTDAELEEVGTVLSVGDGVARIYGLTQLRPANCWNLKTACAPWCLTSKKIT